MQLIPATFDCPDHHVDLTPMIKTILEEDGPPTAYGDRPFEVTVSCPGDGTSGPHPQSCEGRYQP